MIKLYIFIIFIFLIGCDAASPNIEKISSGYQNEINWPSLAESSWPMYRANPQGNCRSKFVGPSYGAIEWVCEDIYLTAGISIGIEGAINTINENPRRILSISKSGQFLWKYDIISQYAVDLHTTPIIRNDGSLICADGQGGNVFALTSNGSLIWNCSIGVSIWSVSLTISKEGIIYCVDKGSNIHAIDGNGNLVWSDYQPEISGKSISPLVFSPDGKTIYSQGLNHAIIAYDPGMKEIIWEFGQNPTYFYPTVDANGNIYTSALNESHSDNCALYCLNTDGSVRWQFEHGSRYLVEEEYGLAIDKMGNILFGYDTLYSLSHEGKLNWKIVLDSPIALTPLVDNIGNIYISRYAYEGNSNQVLSAYNSEGELFWEMNEELTTFPGRCSALLEGKIILSSHRWGDKKIYSIK
ncbi:MAG: hypothetical protein SCALA702_01580 [Melioribacteraceae bacterium]|nr:MAG: hypothetical protein SCALA702_01580 [Melioribacteraceae bacterium]